MNCRLDEVVPLEIVPEFPVEPFTVPPADGGRTIAAFEPLTVPPVGCIPGTTFGVRYLPVFSVLLTPLPNSGGIFAVFLLISSFFAVPPFAVIGTSIEVGLP